MERQFSEMLKGKGKIAAYLELGRFWNGIIAGLLGILAALFSGISSPITAIIIFLAILFTYFTGATINDIKDRDCDSINMPFRPLQKSITIKESYMFIAFSALIAFSFSLLLSINFTITIVLIFLSGLCYSLKPFNFKNRGYIGNIWLSISTVFLTMYSGWVGTTNNLEIQSNILAIMISLTATFVFVNILKDFKDYIGDVAAKKGTAGARHGLIPLSRLSLLSIPFFILTTLIMNFYFFNSYIFLIIAFLGIFYYSKIVFGLCKNPSIENGEKVWSDARFFILYFLLFSNCFLIIKNLIPIF
ncbi:MAG: UbiA family prenyltransferase [Candidatus Aenigmatarchaeota archaeon]